MSNSVLMTAIPVTPAPSSSVINFYNRDEPYYEFTNFFARPIHVDDQDWPTSEHYFQGAKFIEHPQVRDQVRRMKTPREAFQAARTNEHLKRADWEAAKNDVMYRAVKAKFTQHDDLKALLLSTGGAKLVEHTVNDRCWGDGGDGSGENRLGLTLSRVRAELVSAATPTTDGSDAAFSSVTQAIAERFVADILRNAQPAATARSPAPPTTPKRVSATATAAAPASPQRPTATTTATSTPAKSTPTHLVPPSVSSAPAVHTIQQHDVASVAAAAQIAAEYIGALTDGALEDTAARAAATQARDLAVEAAVAASVVTHHAASADVIVTQHQPGVSATAEAFVKVDSHHNVRQVVIEADAQLDYDDDGDERYDDGLLAAEVEQFSQALARQVDQTNTRTSVLAYVGVAAVVATLAGVGVWLWRSRTNR
eukprot:TRINITY_DN7966_c0_g1_i2.p1 TRINITY_DN7966_c0_g1~~TRINITY_DN7966_c0_g1_i2.p1  ORF type:complete len:494 (+),score=119.13 TRINITY_DN7966_c0_g1_i2:208-1482(+)